MTEFAWHPTNPHETNVGRFLADHGVANLSDLRRSSVERPDWFWDAVVRALDVPFRTPYSSVLDVSQGIPWATWFGGGALNVAEACCDRWAAATPDAMAILWESEDGSTTTWTWAELRAHADGVAAALAERGVGPGDRVGIFLPMIPEVVAAVLGIAKLGAVFLPLFSGYEAGAIVSRLIDGEAVALITADRGVRRGRPLDMLAVATEAAAKVASVHTIVVVGRDGDVAPRSTTMSPDAYPSPNPSDDCMSERAMDSRVLKCSEKRDGPSPMWVDSPFQSTSVNGAP